MRPLAAVLALLAVLFLGRALYEVVQFGILAWASLLLGLAAAAGAMWAFQASRRA